MSSQLSFYKTARAYRYCHGGDMRKSRKGRSLRPLSCKSPIHVVFKVNRTSLRHQSLRAHQSFSLLKNLISKYTKRFHVKIEHISIQHDHIHMLIQTTKRSLYLHFFRVLSGQIAQVFQNKGLIKTVTDTLKRKLELWKHRPFSRIVKGYRAYKIVRNYIQLNEKEVLGLIRYQAKRLRGLSMAEWNILWT